MFDIFDVLFCLEVSGFATLCRPTEEGGCGFDYRFDFSQYINKIKTKRSTQTNVKLTCQIGDGNT
jgi:hypothetical protein